MNRFGNEAVFLLPAHTISNEKCLNLKFCPMK